MLKKIDVLMPRYSQYSVLHHFARQFYEALVREGFTCRLLNGDDRVHVVESSPPQLTVGFNGALMDLDKNMYCDILKLPHLSLLVDPPYRYIYLADSPYTMITCDDRYGCKLLESLHYDRSLFMPHAVEPTLHADPTTDRPFDVSLLATFIDYKNRALAWKDLFPPTLCKAMENALGVTFEDPHISFIQAFNLEYETLLKKHSKSFFEKISMLQVLQELEIFVKGYDRVQLAKSIRDVPLHIFGNTIDKRGWKEFLHEKHPNIYFHPGVNYEQALQVMKRSKIILNPSLKNKDGAHERIFSGLACGALVVTNFSNFLAPDFKHQENIVYYEPAHYELINDQVIHYLRHEKDRQELVKKGQKTVLDGHTWDHRVREIMKYVPQMVEKIMSRQK
jgi:spore maturation protein CgeB